MDFNLSEENQLVVDNVEKAMTPWATERKNELREMVKTSTFPEELWNDFAKLGLIGCFVSPEYGGNEMGLVNLALSYEKISAMGISPNLLLATSIDTVVINRHASTELKDKYLPNLVEGSSKFCFALTEPDAGTNSFSMKTSAKKEGDKFVVNGTKTYISGMDIADHMVLVARTTSAEDSKKTKLGIYHGLTMFILPTDAPGISKHPLNIQFNEGVGQHTVFFDNVEIPEDHVIGELDMAAMIMFQSLNPERILAAAMCSGMAEYCITSAVQYAKDRAIFGDTPIGAYQGIAHPLAECKIHHESSRLLMLRAASAFDENLPPQQVGSLANMCKFACSESSIKAADVCLETHGGAGFTEEFGFLTQWNGARLFKTAPISRAMLLNYVAEQELGLPKSY